jgi:hypothetical protein
MKWVHAYIYILYTSSVPKSPRGKLYWNSIATNCLIKVSSCTRSPAYHFKKDVFSIYFLFFVNLQKKQNSKVVCTVFFGKTFGIVLSNILFLIVFTYTYLSSTTFYVNFNYLPGPYVFLFICTVWLVDTSAEMGESYYNCCYSRTIRFSRNEINHDDFMKI